MDCALARAAICEMIALKQEYGEVVVAVGSALNPQNTSAFTQADCALALSPLLPQACVCLPAVDYPSTPQAAPSAQSGSFLFASSSSSSHCLDYELHRMYSICTRVYEYCIVFLFVIEYMAHVLTVGGHLCCSTCKTSGGGGAAGAAGEDEAQLICNVESVPGHHAHVRPLDFAAELAALPCALHFRTEHLPKFIPIISLVHFGCLRPSEIIDVYQ